MIIFSYKKNINNLKMYAFTKKCTFYKKGIGIFSFLYYTIVINTRCLKSGHELKGGITMKKLNKITYSIIVVVFVFLLSFAFAVNKLNKDTYDRTLSAINSVESSNIDEKLTFFGMEVLHFKSVKQDDGKFVVSVKKSKYHALIPFIFAFGATSIIAVISGGVWLLLAKSKRRT